MPLRYTYIHIAAFMLGIYYFVRCLVVTCTHRRRAAYEVVRDGLLYIHSKLCDICKHKDCDTANPLRLRIKLLTKIIRSINTTTYLGNNIVASGQWFGGDRRVVRGREKRLRGGMRVFRGRGKRLGGDRGVIGR